MSRHTTPKSREEVKPEVPLRLPQAVVTKLDVARLLGEMERIDGELTTTEVRSRRGFQPSDSSTMSDSLKDFLETNHIDLKTAQDRAALIGRLRSLKDTVPVIHMTFAVEADRKSLAVLAEWLRKSIHPQAVIEAGLQPSLVAGVYLRTPNHVHDLSLRAALKGSHDMLRKELGSLYGRG